MRSDNRVDVGRLEERAGDAIPAGLRRQMTAPVTRVASFGIVRESHVECGEVGS